jgi:hypothetical protein
MVVRSAVAAGRPHRPVRPAEVITLQPDPLSQLDDWAVDAARRARRAHRRDRWRAAFRRRPRRRARRGPALLLVVALLAAAGAVWTARDRFAPWTGAASPFPTTSHPAGAYATTTATARPTGPFDGTPAARYARGAAGFALPAPARTGAWSAADVRAVLARVRAALAALYVDRRALVEHDPAALLRLLAPTDRARVREGYRKPGRATAGPLVSPTVRLSAEPPRVDGRTTIRAVKDDSGTPHLEIITNYVVVYAFDVPDLGPGSRLVVVHEAITWWYYRGERVAPRDRGLWLAGGPGYTFGMDCAEARKGLLAPARPGPEWPGRADPTPEGYDPEAWKSYYDRERSLDVQSTCGTTPT